MSSPAASVDVETIRTAYAAGLVIFIGPKDRDSTLELRDELRRYVDMLMPEALVITPRMRGSMRSTALHTLRGGYRVLDQIDSQRSALEERSPGRVQDAVFDLATLCRSFLTLITQPGPLSEPIGVEEIQSALDRLVCGRCWQVIVEGDSVEVAQSGDTGSGAPCFVHGVCSPRRPVLVRVPAQPGPI